MNTILSFSRRKIISYTMFGMLVVFPILYITLSPISQPSINHERSIFLLLIAGLILALIKTFKYHAEYKQRYHYLKVAIDAHALVAVTDTKGVITQVNDKFCAISQYSRGELVGKTHSIINSGYHNTEFFKDLWRTINRGEVWVGDICNKAKDGTLYWVHSTVVPLVDKKGKVSQFIAIRADITSRKKTEAKARSMAVHDDLTGLPNRYLMNDRLLRAISNKTTQPGYGAVLMMDLDHFKEVNDTLGHAIGDELLVRAGQRLRNSLRKTDTVSRFGGDEFVMILEYVGSDFERSVERTSFICETIRHSLTQPYQLGGQQLEVTPSIGIVLFSSDEDEPEELIKQADIALYKAKESGRNQVCFFDPSLQKDAIEKALLIRDLRKALERNELALFYQPIVDIDQTIKGVESLIRWHHPRYGLVSPDAFIPLAENSGLILPIGDWILQTACNQQAQWEEDPVRKHWVVSINVSAKQLGQVDFVDTVKSALSESGAAANQISLELTESVLQENIQNTIKKMNVLRRIGVRFSLDDFGTGYSSLSYLKRLPIDHLKIDKSFVDDILDDVSDADIARTIIVLAKSLDVGVIAEGVETRDQYEWLINNGCNYFQGYLFSRPVPQDKLCSTLEKTA